MSLRDRKIVLRSSPLGVSVDFAPVVGGRINPVPHVTLKAARASAGGKWLIHGCPSATASGNVKEQAHVTA